MATGVAYCNNTSNGHRGRMLAFLTATVLLSAPLSARTVAPLMEGYCWTQLSPYNDECPLFGQERSATGCVATALAQIIHYHRYAEGRDEVSYTLTAADRQQLTLQFEGQHYNLDAMSADGIQSADKAELARFNYHVGVSVRMQFGPREASSFGYAVPAGLYHFGYASEAVFLSRSWFEDGEWDAILQNELQHARPVLYTADNGSTSHAFILDGVNDDGQYHVIWGWGTETDGWYALDNLKPAGHDAFNVNHGAVINIAPRLDRETDGVTCYNAIQATRLGLPSGVSDTTMTTGSTMTFTASYLYNFNHLRSTGGMFGLMVEDSEGHLFRRLEPALSIRSYTHLTLSDYYGVFATNAWSQRPGYTLRIPFTVPSDMPDGTYRISLYFIPSFDQTQCSIVRCQKPKPYGVEVHIRDAKLGIGSVEDDSASEHTVLYDLRGCPVSEESAPPGIYVRGGKIIRIR